MAGSGSGLDETQLAAERDALVGKIAAGLAHDLNGPIGIVLGFNDLSRELISSKDGGDLGADEVAKISEYLDLIDGAAKRARVLTQEIWEFAKSTPGESGEFDLRGQLELAARLAAPALRNAGIETPQPPEGENVAEAEPVNVSADRALCSQGLVGLLLEATSALPAGGQIDWDFSENADSVEVTIRAQTWMGDAGEAWTVPDQGVRAMALQDGRMEQGSNPGEVLVSLPRT